MESWEGFCRKMRFPELIDAIRFHHTTPDDTYVDVERHSLSR